MVNLLLPLLVGSLLASPSAGSQTPTPQKRLKMRVAVAPLEFKEYYFDGRYSVPVAFRNAIYEKLVKKLLETGRFVVLEREAYEELTREQALRPESKDPARQGTLWAQVVLKGNVTDFVFQRRGVGVSVGTPRLGNVGATVIQAQMGMNVRLIDTETTQVLLSEEAKGEASSSSFSWSGDIGSVFTSLTVFENSPLGEATTKAIQKAVDQIVKRLEKLPWSAKVIEVDGEEVYLNAGEECGVRVGDRFEVYRIVRIIKDPETGEVLGKREQKVGTLTVREVHPRWSLGIFEGTEGPQMGDIIREA
jgi:hypothetical protein